MKVGYARESTTKASQDQPLEWHIEKLKRYGCDRVLIDRASGAKRDRPGYQEVLELVGDGTATEVVVTELKRFGRSVLEIYRAVEFIQSKGARLTILDGQYDLSTAAGRATFGMNAILAQMERELIQERINAGYDWIRANRWAIRAPFGYRVVGHKLEIDPEVVEVAIALMECCINEGCSAAARMVQEKYSNLPKIPKSPMGLKRWVQCRTLYGHLVYGRHSEKPVIHYNQHPALFDEEQLLEFEEARKFRGKHRGFKSDPIRFPWSGLVHCAECGASMDANPNNKKHLPWNRQVFYRCRNPYAGRCSNRGYVSVLKIEDAAFKALTAASERITDQQIKSTQGPVIDPQLEALQRQLTGLKQLPSNPHIKAAIAATQLDIDNMKATQKQISLDPERWKLLEAFSDREYWEQINSADKPRFYRLLIKQVVCRGRDVERVDLKL